MNRGIPLAVAFGVLAGLAVEKRTRPRPLTVPERWVQECRRRGVL